MIARTLTGDVPAAELGIVDSHDHLFLASPALSGHELSDPGSAAAEMADFVDAGGRTIVSWTPRGLGRKHTVTTGLSRTHGIHVIGATGRHRRMHYVDDDPLIAEDVDALGDRFRVDIEHARCGLIKIGTGYWNLDAHERTNLAAAAHHMTRAPIAVHLELGTAGDLVLDTLWRHGVDPHHVVLGHLGRNPDPYYLADVASSGAFLCIDGPSAGNHRTDWRRLPLLAELVDAGYRDQLLLGGDTTSSGARARSGGPGMGALLTQTAAAIGRALGSDTLTAITVTNPARAWCFDPPPSC